MPIYFPCASPSAAPSPEPNDPADDPDADEPRTRLSADELVQVIPDDDATELSSDSLDDWFSNAFRERILQKKNTRDKSVFLKCTNVFAKHGPFLLLVYRPHELGNVKFVLQTRTSPEKKHRCPSVLNSKLTDLYSVTHKRLLQGASAELYMLTGEGEKFYRSRYRLVIVVDFGDAAFVMQVP